MPFGKSSDRSRTIQCPIDTGGGECSTGLRPCKSELGDWRACPTRVPNGFERPAIPPFHG